MLKTTLIQLYEKELSKVVEEIKLYKQEEDLWLLDKDISNSGGNLALHLIGNINHFFGALLGGTGYVRTRDAEFSSKNVSRADLIDQLEDTILVLKNTLIGLSDDDFQKEYPEAMGGESHTTGAIAVYMLSHLSYHRGQINYHRRLLSE